MIITMTHSLSIAIVVSRLTRDKYQNMTSRPTTHALSTVGVVVSGVRRKNQVNRRRARLVLGWVTVFGRVYRLGI